MNTSMDVTTLLPAALTLTAQGMNENWLVSIGNSDDKLSQATWAKFVEATDQLLATFAVQIHGRWFSLTPDPWQNANWVFELPSFPTLSAYMQHGADLERQLAVLAAHFAQDSIALTKGPVRFIQAAAGVDPIVRSGWVCRYDA